MSETNKTYRIRTNVDASINDGYITIDANLAQDYDTFDILSIKLDSIESYKLHNSNYGVVVGRVLANNGFGIPNAKLSIFIESDSDDGEKIRILYPFTHTYSKNEEGVRYNLLPDEHVGDCHQIVGTFPNKRYMLDDDLLLEVFDKYYKFTTRTNNSGDYLIKGVPVGSHKLHMDLDLSDCGILSQRPRDFVYKGYTIEQFENPNMFKSGTTYENLSQIFTQDQTINVKPFWGNDSLGETLGITRADINVSFTFQPTCVFMGSVVSDNSSQGITKRCMATENMGNMEEMVTGEGTIEMIRKTPSGDIEEFQVKGTQLINANGVWCYQIPMNLDYMMTDEYGNMVPTDDPNKGIPTRTSVRFRLSMQDNEENVDNFFRVKVLVPHNPQSLREGGHEDYDYEFGSKTRDDSFRDLFWNNVYSVKSYIPRFQKRKIMGWKEKKFTGIKNCNFFGQNNPIPYNNIRIKLPLMFTILCALIKCLVGAVTLINTVVALVGAVLADIGNTYIFDPDLLDDIANAKLVKNWDGWKNFWGVVKKRNYLFKKAFDWAQNFKLITLNEGLCPDIENWFFTPIKINNNKLREYVFKEQELIINKTEVYNILKQTFNSLQDKKERIFDDPQSIDAQNADGKDDVYCITTKIDYLIHCIEMNLAMEHKVINFDFYNDWINGLIYVPRFMRFSRTKKVLFNKKGKVRVKIKGCMDDTSIFSKTRRIVQQCAMGYSTSNNLSYKTINSVPYHGDNTTYTFHKNDGFRHKSIFGENGGVCHEHTTSKKQHVYYMKPCEWLLNTKPSNIKVNLFSTDIILLGSLNSCDFDGLPQAFKYLSSTSYVLPPNLALTNMESNGFLYANDNGSICMGKQQQTPEYKDGDITYDSGISIISSDDGLSGEISYLNGGVNDVNYEPNELSDLVALTEIAGISWEYTGPGQGGRNDKKLYNPGGHFLGMSCINSSTSIKTCVNLQRICELGSNMSQRKEEVKSVNDDNTIEYINYAPTGFISGGDLVGNDFRSMFATMNSVRLKAIQTDPKTGYKKYNFKSLIPNNFGGELKNIISNSTLYNNIDNITPQESIDILEKAQIDITSRIDGESIDVKTHTLTLEDINNDYYNFRLGLNYGDLNNGDFQKSKFLYKNKSYYYLPQYENSFYFYFGLRNGATAIDEFNKLYFSECETTKIISDIPMINISQELDLCNAKANIILTIENMDSPYTINYINNKGENNIINSVSDYNEIKYLDWGVYNFIVTDSDGITLQKTVNLMTELFSFDMVIHPFNTVPSAEENLFRGGYFDIKNFSKETDNDFIEYGLYITQEVDKDGELIEESLNVYPFDETINNMVIYLPSLNVKYNIYTYYKCKEGDERQIVFYDSHIFEDIEGELSLKMGFKDNSLSYLTAGSDDLKYSDIWWDGNKLKEGVYDTLDTKVKKWIKRKSIIKQTSSASTFSNNVFNIVGDKIIWGQPQNSINGLYKNNKIFSTLDNPEEYDGYTLSDDFSYVATPSGYSAVVVSGNSVGGKACAYLEKGVIKLIGNSQRITLNDGYVFKPIGVSNASLQYFIYSENITNEDDDVKYLNGLKYDKFLYEDGSHASAATYYLYEYQEDGTYVWDGISRYTINPENLETEFEESNYKVVLVPYTIIEDGLFFPSFKYTVIEKPFKVNLESYIWGKKTLFNDFVSEDGEDSIPSIGDVEKVGLTYYNIENGITFGGKFNKINIPFVPENETDNLFRHEKGDLEDVLISGVGATVYGSMLGDNVNPEDYKKDNALDASGQNTLGGLDGFSGLSFYNYTIEEGYPNSANYDGDIFNTYINKTEKTTYLDGLFSSSLNYEVLAELHSSKTDTSGYHIPRRLIRFKNIPSYNVKTYFLSNKKPFVFYSFTANGQSIFFQENFSLEDGFSRNFVTYIKNDTANINYGNIEYNVLCTYNPPVEDDFKYDYPSETKNELTWMRINYSGTSSNSGKIRAQVILKDKLYTWESADKEVYCTNKNNPSMLAYYASTGIKYQKIEGGKVKYEKPIVKPVINTLIHPLINEVIMFNNDGELEFKTNKNYENVLKFLKPYTYNGEKNLFLLDEYYFDYSKGNFSLSGFSSSYSPVFALQTIELENSEHFKVRLNKLFPHVFPTVSTVRDETDLICIYKEELEFDKFNYASYSNILYGNKNITNICWGTDGISYEGAQTFYVSYFIEDEEDFLNLTINDFKKTKVITMHHKNESAGTYTIKNNNYNEQFVIEWIRVGLNETVSDATNNITTAVTFKVSIDSKASDMPGAIYELLFATNNVGWRRKVILEQRADFEKEQTVKVISEFTKIDDFKNATISVQMKTNDNKFTTTSTYKFNMYTNKDFVGSEYDFKMPKTLLEDADYLYLTLKTSGIKLNYNNSIIKYVITYKDYTTESGEKTFSVLNNGITLVSWGAINSVISVKLTPIIRWEIQN